MRSILLLAALTGCGSAFPNQANYDKIQAEYAATHGNAAHADAGDHGTADPAPAVDKGAAAGHDAAAAPAHEAKPAAAPAAAAPAAAAKGDADKGAEVFKTYCVACHGADGKGMGGLAANFVDDKTRLQKSDAELVKSVREGYQGSVGTMPPWGSVVDEAAAYDAIAFLRREFGH